MLKKAKKMMAIGLALSIIFTMFAGCTPSPSQSKGTDLGSAENSKNGQGNQSVGTLSVYTALPEEFANQVFDEFEKDTGIKVKGVRLSAGEIFARVQAESQNPQASVWYGGSCETFAVAAKDGYLEPYQSPELENVGEEFKDPNGVWNPIYLSLLGILVNNDWLKENHVEKPKVWEDLLSNDFQGQIAIAHPATSGMSYMWLTAAVTRFGEEEAFQYLQKLNKNIFQYTKSSNSPTQMVGLGEAAATFCYNPQYSSLKASGYNVDMIYPEDGTGFEIAAVGLIKNAPEQEAENAKIFIDWLLSPRGQELTAKEFYGIPVNKKAEVPAGLVSLDSVKLMNIDLAWSSENRQRLIDKFETEIRGQENLD